MMGSRKSFRWHITMIKHVALNAQLLGFARSVTEARITGRRRKRDRKRVESERGWLVSIHPVIKRHYQLAESDSPGASSAMHRRLETSLTNRIYIWKVLQLPPRSAFYFIDIVRVKPDYTTLSTPIPPPSSQFWLFSPDRARFSISPVFFSFQSLFVTFVSISSQNVRDSSTLSND